MSSTGRYSSRLGLDSLVELIQATNQTVSELGRPSFGIGQNDLIMNNK
jgi:hypothetical protein